MAVHDERPLGIHVLGVRSFGSRCRRSLVAERIPGGRSTSEIRGSARSSFVRPTANARPSGLVGRSAWNLAVVRVLFTRAHVQHERQVVGLARLAAG